MTPDERVSFQALGQRIAEARDAADLTQVQLADALDISQPQLASYEVGRRRGAGAPAATARPRARHAGRAAAPSNSRV